MGKSDFRPLTSNFYNMSKTINFTIWLAKSRRFFVKFKLKNFQT